MKNKIFWILLILLAGFSYTTANHWDYWIQQIINNYPQDIYMQNTDQTNQINSSQEKFSVYDMWYQFYKMHMILGLNISSMSWTVLWFEDSSYMNIIYDLKDISSYNVIDILEFELDRASVIREYLDSININIIKSDFALTNLKEDMIILQEDMDFCVSQKKVSDSRYIEWINSDYQYALMAKNLEDSLSYGQCISDKKIQYSSKKLLADKIYFYNNILKIKYSYLSKNEEIIANNYDLIRDWLLQNLLDIKKMLEKYNF